MAGTIQQVLERGGLGAINGILSLTGIGQKPLTRERLMARCERVTGLSDWGDDRDYISKLDLAIDCLESGADLSPMGKMGIDIAHGIHAQNRLRVVDTLKRDPTIAQRKIEKPIFIVGWFRTATTSLHNLLSLDPSHRSPWLWELCQPAPMLEDRERDRRLRFAATKRIFQIPRFMAPEQKYAHQLQPQNHEECFFLMANSGVSIPQIMGFSGYRYARELLKNDLSHAYRELRLQYQMLDAQVPGKQWVMKCPLHLWYLDELLQAFPDARIIHTHREAAKAVPSVCSLASIMSRPMARNFNPERHGTFYKEFCREGIDRAMRVRPTLPSKQLFDVRLSDLDRDPVGTLRSIYEHFELDWDEDAMPNRVLDYQQAETQQRKTATRRHQYSAEQFGLSENELREEFEDYESMFLAD